MASIIAYYRPRGIQGNYKVGILLDLKPTEEGKVSRYKKSDDIDEVYTSIFLEKQATTAKKQNPKQSVPVHPVKTLVKTPSFFKKEEGKIVIFTLTRLNYNPDWEEISILIKDTEISGFQINDYITKAAAIEGGYVQNEFTQLIEGNNIEFNKITLIDLDIPNSPLLHQFKSEIRQLRQFMQEGS